MRLWRKFYCIIMKITHIVANGCSWTYGQGLENIKEQNFVTLLGKKLNVPVVNLAMTGCGNDSIVRRTYEYFYCNASNSDSNPFFIINFSQYWRREYWYNYNPHNSTKFSIKDYDNLYFPRDVSNIEDIYQTAFLEHYDPEDFIRRTWLQKLFLLNLFIANNTPAIVSDFANEHDWKSSLGSVKDKFYYMIEKIESSSLINSVNLGELVCDFPKTECGHDGPEAQIFLADFFEKEIKKRYPNLIFEGSSKHVTLTDMAPVTYGYRRDIDWY